jgi:hypothetical protein
MCAIILKYLTAEKIWNVFIRYKVFILFLSQGQFENAPFPKQTGRRLGEGALKFISVYFKIRLTFLPEN